MSTTIKIRRDTAANWTSANPTLAAGEIGLETNTGQIKIGDGSTAWSSLSYGPQLGAVTVSGLLTLTGGQIKFPAAQSASADANTLDDYEEGTWTPVVGGTATYTAQAGLYTKIGRAVLVQGHLTINAIGTGDTGVISNYPFSAGSPVPGCVGFFTNSATAYASLACYASGVTVRLTAVPAGGFGASTDPAVFFKDGADVYFAVVQHI